MGKKESRIVAYLEHSPIRVGDKIVLETIGKKPPRITIEEVATRVEQVAMMVKELAQEMRDGFAKVNARIDKFELDVNNRFEKLENRIDNLVVKNNLKE